MARVLLVDNDEASCASTCDALSKEGFEMIAATSAAEAFGMLTIDHFDVVLSGLNKDALEGLEFAERVVKLYAHVPVIVIAGDATMEIAIAALRAGAWDFLIKPVDLKLLALSVARASTRRELHSEVQRLRRMVPTPKGGRIVGTSVAMKRVYDLVDRVAPGDAPVMICGESGTGKELIAKAIHSGSARTDGPFVAINCAAVPSSLIETELFGHSRGAFTDARADRKGIFVQANGGTLFLDEIGELPLEMQPKLLRALQERTVRPIGSNAEVPFDARLITATNRDLDTAVHEKRFRSDLYYRINVVRIDVPALRERHGDILYLAQHFIDRAAAHAGRTVRGISPGASARLLAYNWPGNVRELENCIESAVALTRSEEISIDDLPARIRTFEASGVVVIADTAEDLVTMHVMSQRYLSRVLAMLGGNKTRAAEVLGIDRRTLYRMMARAVTPPEA